MAATAATRGGPRRAGFRRRAIAACGCLALIASPALAAPATADGGAIYVDAAQGYSGAGLGWRLARSLAPRSRFALSELGSDRDIIARVAAEPGSIGIVQRDFYAQYMREGGRAARLEFYGEIPLCLIAVVGKGSSIHTYGDLVRARSNQPTTLDVGPADGPLALTFETLRKMDPSLANLHAEHRGGARALGRVVTGDTDAALFFAPAPYRQGLVATLIDSGAVDPVPFFSEDIVIGAAQRELPYLLRRIDLGSPGWFASGRPYDTTCTSLGAVVNAAAGAALSDKVARFFLPQASPPGGRPWYAAVGNLIVAALGEVHRLVTGAGDVVVAWFTPASPGGALAAAPGADPAFQPVRDDGERGRSDQPAAAR